MIKRTTTNALLASLFLLFFSAIGMFAHPAHYRAAASKKTLTHASATKILPAKKSPATFNKWKEARIALRKSTVLRAIVFEEGGDGGDLCLRTAEGCNCGTRYGIPHVVCNNGHGDCYWHQGLLCIW